MSNALVIYVVLCLMVAFLGRHARLGFMRSLLLAFLLTPLIMMIYLLLFAAIEPRSKSDSVETPDR
jgi:hypothetical protein